MAQRFEQGDRVKRTEKKLTPSANGQKVNASDDDPRYVLEGEKSGNEAAHKPDSPSKA